MQLQGQNNVTLWSLDLLSVQSTNGSESIGRITELHDHTKSAICRCRMLLPGKELAFDRKRSNQSILKELLVARCANGIGSYHGNLAFMGRVSILGRGVNSLIKVS